MPADVLMPVITEAGDEAVITAWFVDEGQACHVGQLIAEVQAEKVAAEVIAPAEGYVVNRVAIGDPIHQGAAICQVAQSVSDVSASTRQAQTVAPAAPDPVIKASPSAKRVAKELGVDLAAVAGSGPDGRITEGDVRTAAASSSSFAGLRSVIARNMRLSEAETAPVTLFTTVGFGPAAPSNMTACVVSAAALALVDHPDLNGTRDGDVFTASADANIAVAIQTVDGLVAPVVHDVGGQTIEVLAATIRDLADRAKAKSLASSDYEGGTFTVTNLGSLGVDGFTPIINLPQVAILGVGAVRTVPAFDASGAVVARQQVVLSLTFDHAFVDGAPAAAFLNRVSEILRSD